MMKLRYFLYFGLLAALPAYSDVYKHVDEQGNVTYSNTPSQGATKLQDKINVVPSGPRGSLSTSSSGGNSEESEGERTALQEQLNEAQAGLEEAKSTLSEQEAVRLGGEANYQKYLDRIQPFKDAVSQREEQVQQLQKQLGNLH
jgi:hypothetical protein